MTGTSQRQRYTRSRIGPAVWGAGALIVVAFVVLFVILRAAHLWGHHASTTPSKLLWAPPVMKNPKVIKLQSGFDPEHLRLSTHRDYVLKIPPGGLDGTLEIDGGHNVVLIGGEVTVPATANQTDNGADGTDTAIYIKGSTGTVHIEGVLIDGQNPGKTQFDGIDVNAPNANVQIENVRMTGLWGTFNTEHADALQTWGGAQNVKVDNFTAYGDYQGMSIDPNLGDVDNGTYKNVNLVALPYPPALRSISGGRGPKSGGTEVWLTPGISCNSGGPESFTNFYVNNETEGRITDGSTIWPEVGSTFGCPAVLSGSNVTWPALENVSGHITLTAPPGGDFVPAGTVGNGYVSPGYVR